MTTRSAYRAKMIKWVKKYAPVNSKANPDVKLDNGNPGLLFKVTKGKSWETDVDLDGAAAECFADIEGKKGDISLNLGALLNAALKRHDKAMDGESERVTKVTKITPAEMDKLRTLFDEIEKRSMVDLKAKDEPVAETTETSENVTPLVGVAA